MLFLALYLSLTSNQVANKDGTVLPSFINNIMNNFVETQSSTKNT